MVIMNSSKETAYTMEFGDGEPSDKCYVCLKVVMPYHYSRKILGGEIIGKFKQLTHCVC